VSGIDYGRRWSEQQARRRSASLFVAPVILLAGLLLIGIWYESRGHARSGAAWTRGDLHPVTQTAAVGGRYVLYVAAGGFLQVVALDAGTGSTVWWDEASNAGSGRELAAVPLSASIGGRELGPGLFDAGQRHPELLEAATGSGVAWRRRLAQIFPRPAGASTDWG
jgi:hypothetical protein